jgi:hypothetical protein
MSSSPPTGPFGESTRFSGLVCLPAYFIQVTRVLAAVLSIMASMTASGPTSALNPDFRNVTTARIRSIGQANPSHMAWRSAPSACPPPVRAVRIPLPLNCIHFPIQTCTQTVHSRPAQSATRFPSSARPGYVLILPAHLVPSRDAQFQGGFAFSLSPRACPRTQGRRDVGPRFLAPRLSPRLLASLPPPASQSGNRGAQERLPAAESQSLRLSARSKGAEQKGSDVSVGRDGHGELRILVRAGGAGARG